jgi:hypothetical protein
MTQPTTPSPPVLYSEDWISGGPDENGGRANKLIPTWGGGGRKCFYSKF